MILLGLGVSGRPVRSDVRSFQGLRTSGKVTVVRCIGVNVRFQIRTRFWAEFGDFGVKIDEISWMKDGETWGNARSTRNQANPWIKINKTSSNQQIKKNWGLFLVGIFEFRTKSSKRRLENGGGGSKIVINMAHDTKMM